MLGKNNTSLLIQKSAVRKSQFAIKKLSVGVVSVAVGSLLSLGITPVHAEEVTEFDSALSQDIPITIDVPTEDSFENEFYRTDEETHNVVLTTDSIDNAEFSESKDTELINEGNQREIVDDETENIESQQISDSIEDTGEGNESFSETDSSSDSSVSDSLVVDETTEDLLKEKTVITDEFELDLNNNSDEIDAILDTLSESMNESQSDFSLSTPVDILPPKIIDIYPKQDSFVADELRNIVVIVEEDNEIQGLNLTYKNNSEHSNGYYDPQNTFSFYYYNDGTFTRNELNQYVIELVSNEYPRYGYHAGIYELEHVSIRDTLGNTFEGKPDMIESKFTYYQHEGQDFTDPVLVDISTDKDIYHAGETVKVTLRAEEDMQLNNVHLNFNNSGYFGQDSYSVSSYDFADFSVISNGLFEFVGEIQLPSSMGPTIYKLNSLQLNNLFLSEWDNQFLPLSFSVVNKEVEEVITEYEIEYTKNWDEVRSGFNGLKYIISNGDERVIHDVVNEVRMYNSEQVYTDYETIWLGNYDSEYYGGHSWQQMGQQGYKTVYYDDAGNIVDENIHLETIDEVIVVDLVGYSTINPEDTFVADSNETIGFTYPLSYGLPGKKKLIYDFNGNVISEDIISEATPNIIAIGTAEYLTIPFETVYEEDPWRIPGTVWENWLQYGSDGLMKRIYDLHGNIIDEVIISNSVNEIIQTGSMEQVSFPYEIQYTYWEKDVRPGHVGRKYIAPDGTEHIEWYPTNEIRLYEGTLVDIPFETRYTTWRYEVQDGYNGQKFVHSNGQEEIVLPAQAKVILYEFEEVPIEYETHYQSNYNEYVDYEKVLQEGVNGLGRKYIIHDNPLLEVPIEYITSPIIKIIEVGMLTDAIVEERDADPTARTTITLVDYESGYELDMINYSGYHYDYRLSELINNFNNEYGTDIAIYDVKRHKHQTITEFINGEDHSIFHQELIYYVKNHSSLDLRDLHFPLSLDTYTNEPGFDNYARYPHSNVTIFNNERILHNFEFNSLDLTLDNIINKSLNLLDSNQYYFDRTRWYASLINNNGVNRIGNQIDVFVKNHLTKELVSAPYGVDFTNDPTKVRDGQNGTKYIYSDGSERFVDLPINAIKLTATELDDKPIIDSVTVEGLQYNINEVVEVTIKGRSKVDIKEIFVMFTNWHQGRTHALTDRQFIRENIEYNNEFFSAKLLLPIHDFTPMNSIGSSEFNFEFLSIIDITGNENTFNSEKEYSVDSNGMEQITYLYQPFLATFQISDKALLREEIISFNIQYTTDGSLVREGQNGTKWVYSDGSEVILTEPISKVVLYDNEVVDIEPETEYTIYAHEVRSGISGSKLVFTNGEEKVINNPISAVALYRNKVESFNYTTVQVESSDVPFGEKSVLQDGIEGRRVVFYDADDNIVDSLVLSAPVSRIEQVGANKQTLILTPFETTYTTDTSKVRTGQNGTKYIYSDGREETVTEAVTAVQLYRYADESVGYKQITNENPSLAVGKANVLVKGADGSIRVYYDLNGKVVETRRLTEAVDRVVEVGTLVVEDEVIIPELPKPDLDGDKTEEEKPGAESEKSEELNPAEPEDTGPDVDGKDTDESDGKESGSDVDDNESNPKTPDKIDEDTTAIPEGSNDNLVTDQGPLEPINSGIPVNAASILPATGEKGQQVWLTVGAISLLAGFGLVIQGKRKKEEN